MISTNFSITHYEHDFVIVCLQIVTRIQSLYFCDIIEKSFKTCVLEKSVVTRSEMTRFDESRYREKSDAIELERFYNCKRDFSV